MSVECLDAGFRDDPVGRLRPFRNDLILRALWSANDFARQSLELRFLIDHDLDERVYETIYERRIASDRQDLKLFAQFQYFDRADPGESLFSLLPDQTSLAVGLRWDL